MSGIANRADHCGATALHFQLIDNSAKLSILLRSL
jgi:hypothetical protein